jgi:PAS domain S-box-containing protein
LFIPDNLKEHKVGVIFIRFIASIVFFGGLWVVVAWLLWGYGFIPFYPSFGSMTFNNALGFVFGGGACLLHMQGLRKQALIFANFLLFLGILTLFQYLFHVDLGIDNFFVSAPAKKNISYPGRMAPSSALCLILMGIAFSLMANTWRFPKRQIAIRILSVATFAVAVAAGASYSIGVDYIPNWATFAKMDGRPALEFILMSIAGIAYAWTFCRDYEGVLPPMLPVPTSVAIVFGTVFLWQALNKAEIANFQKTIETQADYFAVTISSNIDHRIESLIHLANRWERRGGTPKEEWELDAISYVDTSSGLVAIEWADSTYHVRWVVPHDGNESVKDLDMLFDNKRKETLLILSQSKQTHVSPVINLVQGGKGFLIYIPLFPDGKFDGFIVGAFNIELMFDNMIPDELTKNYSIVITQGEKTLYSRNVNIEKDKRIKPAYARASFYGTDWQVELLPKKGMLETHLSVMPIFTLVCGLVLDFFLFLAVFFGQSAYNRSRELQKTINALNESKTRTEVILKSIGEGVLGINRKKEIIFINPKAIQLLGYQEKEADGKKSDSIFHLANNEKQEFKNENNPIFTPFESQKAVTFNNFVRKKDGTHFIAELSSSPIIQDSTMEGVVVAFRDISERIEAEKKIQESKSRLRAIIDNATSIITLKDIHGNYLMVNKTFLEIFNLNEDSVIGKSDLQIFNPAVASCLIKNDQTVLSGRSPITYEETIPQKEEQNTFITVKFPLFDQQENLYAFCTISTDISDRKLAEVKLLEFLKKLEKTNIDLKEARMKAEAANQAKSSFLANMSHEIRTPLNGVIGMTSLLENSELNEKQKKYVQRINLSGKLLLEIITDILDFSKIEAGELKLESIPCNLYDLVTEIIEVMNTKAEDKELEILLDFDPKISLNVIADPTRFKQILNNLLSNALKFTQKGTISINLTLLQKNEFESMIRIEVKDTGVGIPKDKIETIFDKFSQADVSTTRKFGGTGLGLTICKQIVNMMQGVMGVESIEGEGSTFWVEVPFLIDKSSPSQTLEQFIKTQKVKHLNALILQKQGKARNNLQSYLSLLGIETDTQAEAKSIDKDKKVNLCFIDVRADDALEFATSLGKQGCPVIFFGSEKEQTFWEEKLQSKSYYLSKPIHLKNISKILDEMLDQKSKEDILKS